MGLHMKNTCWVVFCCLQHLTGPGKNRLSGPAEARLPKHQEYKQTNKQQQPKKPPSSQVAHPVEHTYYHAQGSGWVQASGPHLQVENSTSRYFSFSLSLSLSLTLYQNRTKREIIVTRNVGVMQVLSSNSNPSGKRKKVYKKNEEHTVNTGPLTEKEN